MIKESMLMIAPLSPSVGDGLDDRGFAVPLPPKNLNPSDLGGENLGECDDCGPATHDVVSLETAKTYAKHYLLPLFDPPTDQPLPLHPGIAETLPIQWCRDHNVAPLSDDGRTLEVAIVVPDSLLLADEVRTMTGRQMRPFFVSSAVIERLLQSLYPNRPLERDGLSPFDTASASASVRAFPEDHSDGSRLLGRILLHLAKGLVEQILIEPNGRSVQIRARHGGGMYELETLSRSAGKQLLSQILFRCGLHEDASTTRLVASGQSSEFHVRLGERRIAVRATFCPTVSGVMVTLILGKTKSTSQPLNEIGLQNEQYECLHELLEKKSGLILIAGPRRSGKTTTFYSILDHCKTPSVHVCTVEDAVTVDLDGINQVSLCDLPGLSRSEAIDLIAMQLPDIVGIDRLDDQETARMAVQMAAEGALVIASLACRGGINAMLRLKQLGIDETRLSSLLLGTLSQQRFGRLCTHCRQQAPPSNELAAKINVSPSSLLAWPCGCAACGKMGYKGSIVAFDLLGGEPLSGAAAKLPSMQDILRKQLLAGEVAANAVADFLQSQEKA